MLWKNKINWQYIAIIQLAIIYAVGFIGLSTQYETHFAALTPINLLVSLIFILPFVSHVRQTVIFFLIAFIIGMLIEIIGVKTGFPFGNYYYTNLLGPSVFSVPLLIGVNWFLLSYGVVSIFNSFAFRINTWIKILLSALLMTCIDFFIEPFAMYYKLWIWETNAVPFENYVAWFIVSFALFTIAYKLLPSEKNKVAASMLVIMAAFFLLKTFSY